MYVDKDEEGTIFEHCIKAIEKSLNFGEHGLPKIGSGDWNDGFSTVGNKGKGESVWLGFFLGNVLERFSKICEFEEQNKSELMQEKHDEVKSVKYKEIAEKLRKTINTNAWDGRWYNRAFTDDGKVLR